MRVVKNMAEEVMSVHDKCEWLAEEIKTHVGKMIILQAEMHVRKMLQTHNSASARSVMHSLWTCMVTG